MARRARRQTATAATTAASAAPRRNLKQRTLLAIAATDTTFERTVAGDREVWAGKCIHCNARLLIGLDGEPISRATIEHILPKNHGGTDALPNLAVACARCNSEKGVRHDHKPRNDARAREIIAKLEEKRKARWRDPDEPAGVAPLSR